jgi:succinyl-diaminopimelate desuccinylase
LSIVEELKTWDCEARVSKLVSDLVRIPTENPPGDMREIASLVSEYLKKMGLQVELVESRPGIINVVGHLEAGNGPTLVFNGHMDVVPAGDRSRWSWDPFGGEIRDGYVLGRGATDMKGGLGALLTSLTKIVSFNNLRGHLILMAVADEETGGEFGTRFLLEKGYKGDACLIAEPSGQNPTIGQKGNLWLNAVAHGVSAHGSLSPLVGDNAIRKMTDLIDTVYSLWNCQWSIPDSAQALIKNSQSMLEAEGLTAPAQALERVTVNIGKISGGEKVNMVPSQCNAEFDIRIPIGVSTDDVLQKLTELVHNRFSEKVKIEPKSRPNEANFTDPEDPFVQEVLSAIRLVTGKESRPVLQWASSDARYFRYRSIPTLQFGPAELEGIHGYDERVKVHDLVNASRIYALVADKFLTPHFTD